MKEMKIMNEMKKTFLLFSLFSFSSFLSFSQNELPLTYQSAMIGTGKTNTYDTYLSPLLYSGNNIGLIYEQINRTGLYNGRISAQHLLNLEAAETKNQTGTATDYVGSLEYAYGLHYRFKPAAYKIQFFAGIQAGGLVGLVYNTRNGNNPATGKVNLNLNISGMAVYKFRIKKQPLWLRYQLNIPVAGLMFSPEFGQSYYDISEGEHGNLVHFASLHNQRILRNLLSVELPFNSCTLRLAYMNWIYETQVNSLDTRIVSNSFYIGFSRNFFTVSGRNTNKNHYRNVFE
jgi:hypothetical protein